MIGSFAGTRGCGHSATPPLGIGEPSGHVSGLGRCGHSATPPLGIGEPSGHLRMPNVLRALRPFNQLFSHGNFVNLMLSTQAFKNSLYALIHPTVWARQNLYPLKNGS